MTSRYLNHEALHSHKIFIDTYEASELLGVCYESARDYMKQLQEELRAHNIICLKGRVPRAYFFKRFGIDLQMLGDETMEYYTVLSDEVLSDSDNSKD